MFLRKLFNAENKFTWVLIDLLIVVIGVYCAFLIQEYAVNQKTIKEKDKILTALKYELEFFRIQMPGRGGFSENQANKWRKLYDSGTYYNYSTWRFVEPQYNYQIVELSINTENTEIIDFDLYQALQELFVQIKRIEYSERLLTEIGMRYQSIPNSLKRGSPEYDILWATNYENFQRLIQFMVDRSGNQKRLGSKSAEALLLVNERLSPSRKKEIELKLIESNLDRVRNEEEAVAVSTQLFPDFTDQEIRELYRKTIQSDSLQNE